MDIPIVFVHYGDSYYLQYSLKTAKLFNPNKEIILLGDKSNKKYKSFGLKHLCFDDYIQTEDVKEFNSVFKLIGGNKFVGGEKWTRFNFLKIFALKNLMYDLNLKNLWIFDSDVLIIDDLKNHEHKFLSYEYTYHNDNFVAQGLINSIEFLERVTQFFILKFKDEKFLQKNIKDFVKEPTYGLTYMRFFKSYNENCKVKALRLNKIINNETFDECLFYGMEYEKYKIKPFHFRMKQVFFNSDGYIYLKRKENGNYVRCVVMNLSWVGPYLFKRIYKQGLKAFKKKTNKNKFKLMDLNSSVINKWSNRFKNFIKNPKRVLKNKFNL